MPTPTVPPPAIAMGVTCILPLASLLALLVASPASAACTTKRCGADQAAAVRALRDEIAAACDCAGAATPRAYRRCAKGLVRAAKREGRVAKGCVRAVRRCEARSTCGREGAVVCCAEKKGETVGRVKRSAARCGAATACTDRPHAGDACVPGGGCCRAVVERGPPDVVVPGSPLAVADGFQVRANGPDGCAALDGPLVAFNYFSFDDRDAYLRYAVQVGPVLLAHGHRPIGGGKRVETLEAPAGTPAAGGRYEHDEFALAWYASAGGFLDFLRSEAQQSILGDQQQGARQTDYVWGLQRCLHGCAEGPAVTDGLLLLHVFRFEGADLDGSLDRLLGAAGAPPVFYAGENAAELRVLVGALSINPQKVPWGRGVVVFRVPSRAAAVAWTGNAAYTTFRADTAEDVLVLVDPSGL